MYEIKWHKNLLQMEITLNILSLIPNDCHFEHYILIFFIEIWKLYYFDKNFIESCIQGSN